MIHRVQSSPGAANSTPLSSGGGRRRSPSSGRTSIAAGQGARNSTMCHDEQYFAAPGVTVAMDDVASIYKPNIIRKLRCRASPIAIQQGIGVFGAGQVHAITSPILKNAVHAMYVLSGTRPPHHGDVTAANIPVHTSVFRRMVGWVRRRQAPYDLLSNRRNVVYHLRRKRVRTSLNDEDGRADAVLSLIGLDPTQKAKLNDPFQQLLLQLAMELVWDPPVIFIADPLEGLASFEHKRLGSVLHNLAVRLGKTVFLSTTRLPLALYERVDTLLLLGVGGHTFYSGPIAKAKPYFENLGLSETYGQMPQRTNSGFDLGATMYSVRSAGDGDHQQESLPPPPPTLEPMGDSPGSVNSRDSERQVGSTPTTTTSSKQVIFSRPSLLGGGDSALNLGSPGMGPSQSSLANTNHHATTHYAKSSRYFAMESSREQRPLQVTDGETMLDLARLWSESEEDTCLYAVTFFDSNERQELARQIRVTKGLEKPSVEDMAITAAGMISPQDGRGGGIMHHSLVAAGVRNLPFREPNVFYRIVTLLMADAEQSVRRVELYLSVASVLLVLVMCGWAMSHVVDMDQDGMQNVRGIIFFLFVMSQELNLLLIDSLRERVDHYIDQRRSGTVSSVLFITLFLAKLLMSRVVLLSVVAGFFFYAMQNSATNNFVVLWGFYSVTHVLLVFLVVLFPVSTKVVRGICYLISGYFALMSGFLINLTSVPEWIRYTSLLRFGYGAVLNKYLVGRPYSCDASIISNVTSYCYTGDQYLELEGLQGDNTDRSSHVYAVVVGVLTLLCWVRLHFIRI